MKSILFVWSVTFTLLLSLCACSKPEYLSEQELVKFVLTPDNGLLQSKTIDDFTITVSYRPTDLLVKQELESVEQLTSEQIVKARKKYENYYYFVISLSKDNKDIIDASHWGELAFNDLLHKISFQMAEIVNMTTSTQDTIPTTDYIYTRSFGMSHSTDILFVFDKSKAEGKEWLSVNLDEFGAGIGKQSFPFNTEDIKNVPKIFK